MALLLALPQATDGIALLDTVGALSVLYPGLSGDVAAHALATLRELDRLMGTLGDRTSFSALSVWGKAMLTEYRYASLQWTTRAPSSPKLRPPRHSGVGRGLCWKPMMILNGSMPRVCCFGRAARVRI